MSEAAQVAANVPAAVDVEASGFGAGSHPIEIGYVPTDGSSYCTLIRPEPSWTHRNPERTHPQGPLRYGMSRLTMYP